MKAQTHTQTFTPHTQIKTHRQTQHNPTTDTDTTQNHTHTTCAQTQLRDGCTTQTKIQTTGHNQTTHTHTPYYNGHTHDIHNAYTQKYKYLETQIQHNLPNTPHNKTTEAAHRH